MRLLWILVFVAACSAAVAQQVPAGAPANPQAARPPPAWADPDRTEPPLTKYKTFYSATTGTEVSYLIYLPPDYEKATAARYPVIYWAHGIGSSQRVGASCGLVTRMDAGIRTGTVSPLIIVFLNGMRDSWYIDTADGKKPVESVIIKDLIPHIDKTYRTIATRSGRAIEGFSMGGFGAAHLGFKFPEVFGTVSILSGAMLPATTAGKFTAFGTDQEFFAANSARKLIERNAEAIRGWTRIRIVAGDADRAVNIGPRQFHQIVESLNIPHEWILLPGVTHDVRMVYEALGDRTEKFYAAAFQSAKASQ